MAAIPRLAQVDGFSLHRPASAGVDGDLHFDLEARMMARIGNLSGAAGCLLVVGIQSPRSRTPRT